MFKSFSLVFVAATLSAGVAAAAPSYVGVKACRKCHMPQAKSWAETKMAKAIEALKPGVLADAKKKAGLDPAADYSKDAKCLKCHTTGYGEPGGYNAAAPDVELAGVGCEMCHGAGSEYLTDERMSNKNKEFKAADLKPFGFFGLPDEATCLKCHNKESPFFKPFNFAERVKQGTHAHSPLKFKH
jgi:hypothetical protein